MLAAGEDDGDDDDEYIHTWIEYLFYSSIFVRSFRRDDYANAYMVYTYALFFSHNRFCSASIIITNISTNSTTYNV